MQLKFLAQQCRIKDMEVDVASMTNAVADEF